MLSVVWTCCPLFTQLPLLYLLRASSRCSSKYSEQHNLSPNFHLFSKKGSWLHILSVYTRLKSKTLNVLEFSLEIWAAMLRIFILPFCLNLVFLDLWRLIVSKPKRLVPCRADQGRFLDYIVSWGNLTEERVALYLTEVLEALHYLHSWRIAHLDLKVNKYSWNNTEYIDRLENQQENRKFYCCSLNM